MTAPRPDRVDAEHRDEDGAHGLVRTEAGGTRHARAETSVLIGTTAPTDTTAATDTGVRSRRRPSIAGAVITVRDLAAIAGPGQPTIGHRDPDVDPEARRSADTDESSGEVAATFSVSATVHVRRIEPGTVRAVSAQVRTLIAVGAYRVVVEIEPGAGPVPDAFRAALAALGSELDATTDVEKPRHGDVILTVRRADTRAGDGKGGREPRTERALEAASSLAPAAATGTVTGAGLPEPASAAGPTPIPLAPLRRRGRHRR